MPGQGDDAEQLWERNYESAPEYTNGMLKRDIESIRHGVQLISPSAAEVFLGNVFTLGTTPAQLAPYDRTRKKAIIQVPSTMPGTLTAQTGGVWIGTSATVRSGGGFWIAPGGSLSVDSIAEVVGLASVSGVAVSVALLRQGGDVI